MAGVDCKSPANVAEALAEAVCVTKVQSSFVKLFVLGILAGAYIGFGAEISTLVGHDAAKYVGFGIAKFLSGAVFSTGLMLVVIAGAELFTGNILIIISLLRKKVNFSGLLRNWGIVYLANLIGSLILVLIVYHSNIFTLNESLTGAAALKIASAKVNLTWTEVFTRGILCNWLVCLAVWMAMASRDVVGKVWAIFFPIMAFVASGFEHCVANMYFIPKGILLTGIPSVVEASGLTAAKLANLTWAGFITQNLIPATLGNIFGAAVFVAGIYWIAYLKDMPVCASEPSQK